MAGLQFQDYSHVDPSTDDILVVLDVSDHTDSINGTTKRVAVSDILTTSIVAKL